MRLTAFVRYVDKEGLKSMTIRVWTGHGMDLDEKLALCYDIIMLSARSGLLNARGVRTGYTHWLGPELSKEVRFFTGYVSENALNKGTNIGLVLEHYLGIQRELTSLIKKHMEGGENTAEFITVVKHLEQVHIVTKEENTTLRRKEISGSYEKAGIPLIHWQEIPFKSRMFLRRKLIGKVANADEFLAS